MQPFKAAGGVATLSMKPAEEEETAFPLVSVLLTLSVRGSAWERVCVPHGLRSLFILSIRGSALVKSSVPSGMELHWVAGGVGTS